MRPGPLDHTTPPIIGRYDGTAGVEGPQVTKDQQAEIEKSRVSAARLLNDLSEKLRRGAVSGARGRPGDSIREMTAGVQRVVRRRPIASIAIAVLAGFLVGRALSAAFPSRLLRSPECQ